jgi:hypothetical protein
VDRAEFEAEADLLLRGAHEDGVVLRLLGALAFARRCPRHLGLQESLGRHYTDIDFAAYGKQAEAVRAFLAVRGYVDDPQLFVDSEGTRLVAAKPSTGMHLDVFFDKLEFCHTIPFKGRLEIETDTIPLAEMLMQKMQIVEINEKDLIDTIMLLLEHPLGDSDAGSINIARIAAVCAGDWGWWRTMTMNLEKVRQMSASYGQLPVEQKRRVAAQVEEALSMIDAQPKSLGWKVRSKVGDRRKWYRDVGELTLIAEER